ncbi:MAG: hypothetical protein EXR62_15040 [Chloroflexi bacterium]|nr:hypothetical protein [Chloroflexota bacterium]
MVRLNVRLLGGFEVWYGDKPVSGFESQRVRALLIYLLMHREGPLNRDRLAGLLWPERDDNTARRNLRQAMYNLRTQLPDEVGAEPLILSTNQTVQINPAANYWLDVSAFEEGIHAHFPGTDEIDPHLLAETVQLYQGDFLASFFLGESPGFEHWLLFKQERLREAAIQALHVLVDYYIRREGYRLGIQYAARLLEIDPLSEQTHRYLIRLYALSGRRNRALAQYEDCRTLLLAELGVEPLAETTALYQAILNQKLPVAQVQSEDQPVQLYIPFVGRSAALGVLRRDWDKVLKEKGRLVLIEGEAGIGKSRLMENFLQVVQMETPVTLLRGRCCQCLDSFVYQPLIDMLRAFCAVRWEAVSQALGGVSPQTGAIMALLIPELSGLHAEKTQRASPGGPSGGSGIGPPQFVAEKIARAILEFLNGVLLAAAKSAPVGPGRHTHQAPTPLIMWLEDMQWASDASLEVLKYMISYLAAPGDRLDMQAPVWIVITYENAGLESNEALQELLQQLGPDLRVSQLFLKRLNRQDMAEIAEELVGEANAPELAVFLEKESGGLPLAITQLFEFLCDENILVAAEAPESAAERGWGEGGRWSLAGPLPVMAQPTPHTLEALILRRIEHLPTSARRLLTLAAVFGQPFEARLLQEAAKEQPVVVEAGIEIWLERRLARRAEEPGWQIELGGTESNRPARNGQRQYLELMHGEICQAIYNDVNPKRREIMHKEIAVALERSLGSGSMEGCELLAFHYQKARDWRKAITYLHLAGDKALLMLADASAIQYYRQALEILTRLETGTAGRGDKPMWLVEDRSNKSGQDKAGADSSGAGPSGSEMLEKEGIYQFSKYREALRAGLNAALTRSPGATVH